jgi:hypothetical protein
LTGVFSLVYPCETYFNKLPLYRDEKENLPKLVYRSLATGDERSNHGVPRELNPGRKVPFAKPSRFDDRITDLPSIETFPRSVLQTHTLGFACEE